MRCERLVLASRNPGKLREIRRALGELPVRVVPVAEVHDAPAPEETRATFAENARDKALYYARATGHWCLADDSGLVVDALGGAPGVYSARYAVEDLPPDASRDEIDRANNAKLLAEMKDVPEPQRTARFVCHLAMASPQSVLLEAQGRVEGRILRTPRGENGFGYDPVFFIPSCGCTAAELSPREKNRVSHRGKAVRRFVKLLEEFLSSRG